MTRMPVAQIMTADEYLDRPRPLQHRLSELWLADTEADAILVFHRSTATAPDFDVGVEVRRDEILTSPLLPGFELALERLFG